MLAILMKVRSMFRKSPPPPQQSSLFTCLSKTSEISGSLHAEGFLHVDGVIHGTVEVQGDIEISETGLIEGPEVRGRNIILRGVIKARVVAEQKLVLSRTARLEGDVIAGALEIEEGALYTGYIQTGDAKELPSAQEFPELPASVGEQNFSV